MGSSNSKMERRSRRNGRRIPELKDSKKAELLKREREKELLKAELEKKMAVKLREQQIRSFMQVQLQ